MNLPFKEFVKKYGLKNEATSNVKIKGILDKINRHIHDSCKVYMRDDKFTTDSGIVNLHPSVGTHWVINIGQYSEYQIQKNDSYCAAYCLYVLYLTQSIGFKNAVLSLYYQTFCH